LICEFEKSFVDEEDSPIVVVVSQICGCSSTIDDDGGGGGGGSGGKGKGKDDPLCPFCFC
jgi:hypothetical protein